VPVSGRDERGLCYAYVMTIRRITISVSEEVAGRIKKAAGATPVSTWVTDVIEERLDDAELERRWQEFCRDVDPTRQDIRRAESMLQRLTKRGKRRGAA
jgi:hypothetical protein